MMELLRWVVRNRLFYKGRTLIVGGLCGLLLFASVASAIFMQHLAAEAEKPLAALNTELIIQKSGEGKQAAGLKTGGLIIPFGMDTFSRSEMGKILGRFDFVRGWSTVLLLWQLDTKGTLVIAGLKKNDPAIGLRNIEIMLIKGRFFGSDGAEEVILERHYAAFFGYELGGHYQLGGKTLQIIGIVDFVNQSNLNTAAVFLPYQTAAELSGTADGIVNQVYVALNSAADTKRLTDQAAQLMPGFQIITKDSLYKNLKGLSGIMFSFGKAVTVILFLAGLLLILFLLKIHTADFRDNRNTLAMLGWPSRCCRQWVLLDTSFILLTAALFCALLTALLVFAGLPALDIPLSPLKETIL